MYYMKKYEYCLEILRRNTTTFNVFDLMSLLEIYFEDISFYPSVCNILNSHSNYFKIENINLNVEVDIYTVHNLIWKFI
ncbi:MAG: hypothetical protein ACRDA3_06295 [Peptostreptococcaceae bacterium]